MLAEEFQNEPLTSRVSPSNALGVYIRTSGLWQGHGSWAPSSQEQEPPLVCVVHGYSTH